MKKGYSNLSPQDMIEVSVYTTTNPKPTTKENQTITPRYGRNRYEAGNESPRYRSYKSRVR